MAEQENMFLKLGTIKGKATSDKFKDQLVVQSLSYGIAQSGEWEEGDRLSGCITTFGDLTVLREMDSASPSIAVSCATKEQFPKAEFSITAGTKDAFYKLIIEQVIITSVSVGMASGDSRPKETMTLRYRKASWEWGTAKGGYDLAQNKKV